MKNIFFVRMMACILILTIISQGQLAFAVENTSILKNSAEPTILYEDETKRGEFEKHYICSDGSYVAATYPEQVCYLDEDGIWQEIDNSLKKVKGRFENKASDTKVSFAETTTDIEVVKLSNDNSDLSWNISFPKAENSTYSFRKSVNSVINNSKIVCEISSSLLEENDVMTATNIESHVTYENIYSDTVDVQYTVLPGRVKENIIINEKTNLPSYNMNISCDGLTAKIDEENSVEFYDANGELQYEIQTPYMFDDIYELSYDIEIALEETEAGYMVTFYPDQEWLNSDERVYPITIDPTVKTGTEKANFSDTYIYQGDSASTSRCFEERLRVGVYNDKVYRVFWKTSKLPTIGSNANITSANIVFKLPDATTTSRSFSIYQVKSSWTSESITWSKASDFSYTKLQSDVDRNAETNKVKFSGTKLTNVVKDWYNNGGNNGFYIRYTDETKTNPDYNLFYSSDNTTSTSYMPTLTINYETTSADNSSDYDNFTGILSEKITINGISLPIDTPMRHGLRYISQEGAPGYSGTRIDSVNFRTEYWGDYSSNAGCAVASTSMALFTLGIDKLPKDICTINKKSGGSYIVMQWSLVASAVGCQYTDKYTSDIDTYLNKYLNNPLKYSAPIIKINASYSHYVTIVGKNSNGTYKALDPSAHTLKDYNSGCERVIQYYK